MIEAEAIDKIQSNEASKEATALVDTSESGYATLIFPYDKKQVMELSWVGS